MCPLPSPVGPWPTFEIQLPQDDFHFLAWHFGEQIAANNLCLSRTTYHFRGLGGEETLLNGKYWVDKSWAESGNKTCLGPHWLGRVWEQDLFGSTLAGQSLGTRLVWIHTGWAESGNKTCLDPHWLGRVWDKTCLDPHWLGRVWDKTCLDPHWLGRVWEQDLFGSTLAGQSLGTRLVWIHTGWAESGNKTCLDPHWLGRVWDKTCLDPHWLGRVWEQDLFGSTLAGQSLGQDLFGSTLAGQSLGTRLVWIHTGWAESGNKTCLDPHWLGRVWDKTCLDPHWLGRVWEQDLFGSTLAGQSLGTRLVWIHTGFLYCT